MASKGFMAAVLGIATVVGAYKGLSLYSDYKTTHIETKKAPELVKRDGPFIIIEDNNIAQPLADEKAVLYFTTPGCVPCKIYKPHLVEALVKHSDIRAYEVEVDNRPLKLKNMGVKNALGVNAYPTTVLLKSRQVVGRVIGNRPEELEEKIKKIEK